jgi:hypothetical protein
VTATAAATAVDSCSLTRRVPAALLCWSHHCCWRTPPDRCVFVRVHQCGRRAICMFAVFSGCMIITAGRLVSAGGCLCPQHVGVAPSRTVPRVVASAGGHAAIRGCAHDAAVAHGNVTADIAAAGGAAARPPAPVTALRDRPHCASLAAVSLAPPFLRRRRRCAVCDHGAAGELPHCRSRGRVLHHRQRRAGDTAAAAVRCDGGAAWRAGPTAAEVCDRPAAVVAAVARTRSVAVVRRAVPAARCVHGGARRTLGLRAGVGR